MSTGEGYFYDFLGDQQFISINEPLEHIYKLCFLENALFMIIRNRLDRILKLVKLDLPLRNISQRVQLLDNLSLNIEDIIEFDSQYRNLVIIQQGTFLVYKLPESLLIYQVNNAQRQLYSKDHIITINYENSLHLMSFNDLTSHVTSNIVINDDIEFLIYDYFPEFFVFSDQNSLKVIFFDTGRCSSISNLPDAYYIGKESSVAVFLDHLIIMNKEMDRINIRASNLCCDLVGIILIYNDRHNILIVDIKGNLLQTIQPNVQILIISANRNTQQFILGTRNNLLIYD